MKPGREFNIITGEILKYPDERRFKSMQHLRTVNKLEHSQHYKIKLPSLGTPKDKKAFQYSYTDKVQSPQQANPINTIAPRTGKTTMNYTFQNKDLITHRSLNPNFVHLKHQDFTHQIRNANAKGILTAHIDKARAYAPNFHDDFPLRVQKHQFNRKLELCEQTMRIQKSYGLNKYFRKFK